MLIMGGFISYTVKENHINGNLSNHIYQYVAKTAFFSSCFRVQNMLSTSNKLFDMSSVLDLFLHDYMSPSLSFNISEIRHLSSN